MNKAELRQIYRQKRINLSEQACRSKDGAIVAHLSAWDWSACRYLHVYRAIRKFNEPDMSDFVSWVRAHQPQISLVVSKSSASANTMTHYIWDGETRFEENVWGISEPVDGQQVADSLLDAVLVPMLVADRKGNRVGYGKGFYDRFLARCRPDIQAIGISYFEVLDTVIDVGHWDMPLKKVVTPDGVFIIGS